MKKVEQLMQRRRWEAAGDELDRLLALHTGADYARLRRIEIAGAAERIAFYREHTPPALADLVSAESVSWDADARRLVLRYAPRRGRHPQALSDFQRVGATAFLHPALFDGPCSIEVRGRDYPRAQDGARRHPALIGGDVAGLTWRAFFGLPPNQGVHQPPRLVAAEGGGQETLDEQALTPAHAGERFRLRLELGRSTLTAFYNGRAFLHGSKLKDVFGRVGFDQIPLDLVDEIRIQGHAQPAWVQNLRDAALASEWTAFEAGWRAEEHLPGWLLGRAPRGAAPRAGGRVVPGPAQPGQAPYVGAALERYNARRYEEGLAYLRRLDASLMSAPARDYLLAEFLFALDRPDEAAVSLARVRRADPGFLGARILAARLEAAAGSPVKAEKMLAELLQDAPDDAIVLSEYARVLLRLGRPGKAKQALDHALETGADPAAVAETNELLVKALSGPKWDRVFEHRSKHYRVRSDIDLQACRDAAQVLEQAWQHYVLHLQRPPKPLRRLPVYLFSGEAGYQAYVKDLLGSRPENTAGVYLPLLKQLLIWNLPDRSRMMQTVRHEGFHQYLDGFTGTAPVWFNEGMAEYYEVAGTTRGKWAEGQVQPAHAALLRRAGTRMTPLREFIRQDREAFYADPVLSYAEAWALVHFLRHGGSPQRQAFGQLFQSLVDGRSGPEALALAFGRVRWDAWDRAFREYVSALPD